jgi:cytochrome c biogenesis protein CcmG, thiol:disulfide interchange protein DsbE
MRPSHLVRLFLCACIFFLVASPVVFSQNSSNAQSNPVPEAPVKRDAETELALQNAISSAGNDSAALVRNLKAYLQKYPDAPRKAAVYRALVEACDQIRDNDCALQYAEQLIAVRPDDSDMMLLAVNLLNQRGDDASLTRASGYVTRVLDRVEKTTPDQKPARVSLEDWQEGQAQLRTALYFVRGRIEYAQRNYDAAARDLQTSYSIRPNALAAELLGGIAELHGDSKTAIEEYARAFVLPETGPAGKVDRREVRKQLGNVWRQVHGGDRGLGDAILAAYDATSSQPSGSAPNPAARNKNARDAYEFVLRGLNGGPIPLAPLKGKVVVLSFWATWCGPCRELEPMFDQVAKSYAGNGDVAFLAINTDDDESQVAPFLAHQKFDVPVAYADGLNTFMKVESLPTVVILGRDGEIVYRVSGLTPDGFTESLNSAIQDARSNR